MSTFPTSPLTGVIVTGGASGIGLACANALAASGRPVALWDLREADAARAAAEIRERHVTAAEIVVDGGNISSQRG